MPLKIKKLSNPTKDQLSEILDLYIAENWWDGPKELQPVLEIIKGSHIFVAAFHGERIVGMGRAISDGVSDAYIQDVTIHNEFRKKGIGALVMEKLINELKKDKIFWIGLISEKNSHGFYEKIGFSQMENTRPMKFKI